MHYYIDAPMCKVTNKKTLELQNVLSRYKHTIIEFGREFTAKVMFQCLQNYVAGINQNNKGAEISVGMREFNETIHFSFTVPNKGDAVASIIMKPVYFHIDCEDLL